MKKTLALVIVLSFLATGLSGCTVRTYKITHDRVDQDLSGGNRGYLKGNAPAVQRERKATRDTQAVEIELGFSAKGKKASAKKVPAAVYGKETALGEPITAPTQMQAQQYKVQKGDTLQKISQKFYGTTKKWYKIYEANKGVLKAPDKIYPGQTINIPVEK